MNLRNLSLFRNSQTKQKSYYEYLFDTFNWLYEHSPINFSYVTGLHHPSMPRLTGNPFLGRALEVTKDAGGLANEIQTLAKLAEKDPKGRAYLTFGLHPTVLVTRPADIAQIMLHNDEKIDRGMLLDAFVKIFGESIFTAKSSDETWRQKRHHLIEWIMQKESLAKLVTPMQTIVDEFLSKIAKDKDHVASLEAFMVSLTMDVIARIGLAANPLKDTTDILSNGFGAALENASDPMNTVFVRLDALLKYINYSASKHLNIERDKLQKIIKDNFYQPNLDNLQNKTNILQDTFKQLVNDPEHAFEKTVGDIGILLLAGHETTARLLQFTIILLTKHPDILQKVRSEIAANRPQNGEWTHSDLGSLTYLERVFKETLRLYPPFPILPRMVTDTFVLADIPLCSTRSEYEKAMQERDVTKDVVLHPNTGIDIAPLITHRLASVHKDPLTFNPDRYKNGSVDSSDGFTWIPFGVGNRNCPGKRFALQEAKLFLAQFIEKYDFTASCKEAELLDITLRGTLKHKGETQLDIVERHQSSLRNM